MSIRGGRWRSFLVIALLAGTACGSPDGDDSPPPLEHAELSEQASTPGEGGRATKRRFAPARLKIRLRLVADGLDSPVGVTDARDGSGLLFVVQQGGQIRIVEQGEVLDQPFLDVTALTEGGGESGLLGLAFHPNYERNGRFFVNYTDTMGDTVIAEYRRSPTDDRSADPASDRILMRIGQPFGNHNGGHLAFGPDGYLYIGMGDGGSRGDPQGNGQRLDTLLGKMLRIDVDEREETRPYGIPPDNPFVNRQDARPEIWASGLRNPWRYSFDRKTDLLWIADVGENDYEEVNRALPGKGGLNYGWNVMEGNSCFDSSSCDRSGLKLPLAVYSHDRGCSVTGGFVYRGERFPAMKAGYYFSDYCSGTIWGVPARGERPQEPRVLRESERSITSFGEDEDGELYVTDVASGSLLRVVDRSAERSD